MGVTPGLDGDSWLNLGTQSSTSTWATVTASPTNGATPTNAGAPPPNNGTPAASTPANKQIVADRWQRGVNNNGSLSQMLLNNGYTASQILTPDRTGQTLLQRVASSNHIEDPNKIIAGHTYTIPTPPKPTQAPTDQAHLSPAAAEANYQEAMTGFMTTAMTVDPKSPDGQAIQNIFQQVKGEAKTAGSSYDTVDTFASRTLAWARQRGQQDPSDNTAFSVGQSALQYTQARAAYLKSQGVTGQDPDAQHAADVTRMRRLAQAMPRAASPTTAVGTPQPAAGTLSPAIGEYAQNVTTFNNYTQRNVPIPQLAHADAQTRLNDQVNYWMADHSQDPQLNPQQRQFAAQMRQTMQGYIGATNNIMTQRGLTPDQKRTQFAGLLAHQMMQDVNPQTGPHYTGLWLAAYQYLHSGQ